jgi:hypothetical protein
MGFSTPYPAYGRLPALTRFACWRQQPVPGFSPLPTPCSDRGRASGSKVSPTSRCRRRVLEQLSRDIACHRPAEAWGSHHLGCGPRCPWFCMHAAKQWSCRARWDDSSVPKPASSQEVRTSPHVAAQSWDASSRSWDADGRRESGAGARTGTENLAPFACARRHAAPCLGPVAGVERRHRLRIVLAPCTRAPAL